ncbi:nucleotidyltransferase domain-containing protein [Gaoshiqia sediminis]|uniref:Nucleotidyltransferase domain-containing protein n=1 Tax=Gaoshiqia sediminis TaxID=2986998 RepID=A0AA41YDY3_9BACT|nr:nucleotidyltransferase domain-containing protein [Gaoshiqia sediminis]MCW0485035.1 nucleotidyltransferase domain-containing protein [Gaoshiqia sediminis]
MRLKPEIKTFIKQKAASLFPGADVYLFGSRLHDDQAGGDIDLMLLSDCSIDKKQIRLFRREFYKKFGWQKIDLVQFSRHDQSIFKQLISKEALLL